MRLEPFVVEARVDDSHHETASFLGRKIDQRLERIRRTSPSTGAGTGQHQSSNRTRVSTGELLGHHASETDSEDETLVPTDMPQQFPTIGRVSRHRVRTIGDVRLTQATLIVNENGERSGKNVDQRTGQCDRRP